ncbi:DUF4177 domain-containing protein [Halalkalicoccus jeotgali]|uniref:DUF4177 domain-containing protein n=1 Tax=Halalkalicoccus jeotgali (strain DSM 18796 / CECT 7217 / JCM 14584 / KCTC 4019 / B3) TaxID=795797 RepID=D8JC43_HALJB|nr:DUF4177 domain-containing protein [Halalkalicoccus jeotgali]ADJ16950.1 hypothetical protein HacjB3_18038 [Halalkalicoccus jeotgali B3]ADJ16981.1 hypothetical protein HacjB3_18193 [Halalkalicoccus jeotgali B3]ELY38613.1 hypothetical protein C497_06724 [Halalkalicoccus jeotgali B3]
MSASDDYEYKMIQPSTGLLGIKTENTEKKVNRLAKDGWELDEVIENWFWGDNLIFKRPRSSGNANVD